MANINAKKTKSQWSQNVQNIKLWTNSKSVYPLISLIGAYSTRKLEFEKGANIRHRGQNLIL